MAYQSCITEPTRESRLAGGERAQIDIFGEGMRGYKDKGNPDYPWIAPIPGTRKPDRLRENLGAAEIDLSLDDVSSIDEALDAMGISEVFGGSTIKK